MRLETGVAALNHLGKMIAHAEKAAGAARHWDHSSAAALEDEIVAAKMFQTRLRAELANEAPREQTSNPGRATEGSPGERAQRQAREGVQDVAKGAEELLNGLGKVAGTLSPLLEALVALSKNK